jgi:hypothetical protein
MSPGQEQPAVTGATPTTADGDEFDELARRAGAALRRPAPDDGVRAIAERRRRDRRLKVAAVGVVAVASVVAALALLAGGPGGEELVPADSLPEPSPLPRDVEPDPSLEGESAAPAGWVGPVDDRSDDVQPLDMTDDTSFELDDPLDATEAWVDVQRVWRTISKDSWFIDLAARPPAAAELEPGVVIAYGLVLDADRDAVADYVIGIDNDAPQAGDFRVWVTDLETGVTEQQIGPPYGFPVEFTHPGEAMPGLAVPQVNFGFLRGTAPTGLDPGGARFYAWSSVTRDGEVVAWDYAPDTGWTGP